MKASVVTAYSGPEVMKYRDMPDPKPGGGDVLVEVAGIGINPEDMLERTGVVEGWQLHFSAIIGLDGSGTVAATGDGVTACCSSRKFDAGHMIGEHRRSAARMDALSVVMNTVCLNWSRQ